MCWIWNTQNTNMMVRMCLFSCLYEVIIFQLGYALACVVLFWCKNHGIQLSMVKSNMLHNIGHVLIAHQWCMVLIVLYYSNKKICTTISHDSQFYKDQILTSTINLFSQIYYNYNYSKQLQIYFQGNISTNIFTQSIT